VRTPTCCCHTWWVAGTSTPRAASDATRPSSGPSSGNRSCRRKQAKQPRCPCFTTDLLYSRTTQAP
jgi:hypothetical protein